jgi:hypothetical protein
MVAGSPTFASQNPEASAWMLVDPYTASGTTGGNVYFALAGTAGTGKIYQYDR